MNPEVTARPAPIREHISDIARDALPHRFVRFEPGISGTSETWLDPADPIFAHHFPEWPVLPGSFVLRIALASAAKIAGLDHWRLATLDRMAFRQGARPGTMLRVEITRAADDGAANPRFSFTATTDNARVADGLVTLIATGAP